LLALRGDQVEMVVKERSISLKQGITITIIAKSIEFVRQFLAENVLNNFSQGIRVTVLVFDFTFSKNIDACDNKIRLASLSTFLFLHGLRSICHEYSFFFGKDRNIRNKQLSFAKEKRIRMVWSALLCIFVFWTVKQSELHT
jgi:hypothetical protein